MKVNWNRPRFRDFLMRCKAEVVEECDSVNNIIKIEQLWRCCVVCATNSGM